MDSPKDTSSAPDGPELVFGRLLRGYRLAAGLTQEQLAERANLSARAIGDLERGTKTRPHRYSVTVLADALSLSAEDRVRLETAVRRSRGRARRPVAAHFPIDLTPLIGREQDEATAVHLLHQSGTRLLTLTGPGGVGKTRLALQAARSLAADFGTDPIFVSLAPLRDAALVPVTILQGLERTEEGGQSPQTTLLNHLRGLRLLVVLDNFEHVLEAAPCVAALLKECHGLKVLVTSRTPLHIQGEQEFEVAPLEVPSPESLTPAEDLSRYSSVALFVQRARSVRPNFRVTDAELPVIAEICARLDGLPLALELAAARTKLLPPRALLAQLEHRLPLLTGGSRDAPRRQWTMRDTIAWSYDLLEPHEQHLFRQLSVFSGGFTVQAVESVCDTDVHGSMDSVNGLSVLMDRSLIRRDGNDEQRIFMLETIREYAAERLQEAGATDRTHRAHALYFLDIARSANLTIEADGEMHHDIVIRDRDNMRGALEWARDSGEVELGLELATALENYWTTNSPQEGMRWLDELLARAGDGIRGDLRAAALRAYGSAALIDARFETGEQYYEASLAEYRRIGDQRGIGIMSQRLAIEALRNNDTKAARSLAEESLRLHQAIAFTKGEALGLGALGYVELQDGHDEEAFALFERSAALSAETGFTWWRAGMLLTLSELLFEHETLAASDARVREALSLVTRMGDRLGSLRAVALLARVAGASGQSERAGRLWGAIEAEEARAAMGQWEGVRDHYSRLVLSNAGSEFEQGRREGARLSLSEAVEEGPDLVR